MFELGLVSTFTGDFPMSVGTVGVMVGEDVVVGEFVGVLVAVFVGVDVRVGGGVKVSAATVRVAVAVAVAVEVAVRVGVEVAVRVDVAVTVGVDVNGKQISCGPRTWKWMVDVPECAVLPFRFRWASFPALRKHGRRGSRVHA